MSTGAAPVSGGELPRLLSAFAALGAGLIFFALSADGLLAAGGPVPVAAGVAAGLWAAVHTGWGISALRGEPVHGRVAALMARTVGAALPAVAVVVITALVWNALLAPAADRSFNLTLACGLALVLLQLACRGALRRRDARSTTTTAPSPVRLLGGLFLSAVLVAAITTPGLAASTAGDNAVPHGGHGTAPASEGHNGH